MPYGPGFRVLTPPVVDWYTIEGESVRLDLLESTPPPILFRSTEVHPVLVPARHARVWDYGDLFSIALRKLDERGMLHLRIQSAAVALWTSQPAWFDAVQQLADALEVKHLRATRVDVCVDVEGLDVVHELIDYCVGHRGGLGGGAVFKPGANGGRQIEIGSRRASKRFLRIYLKTAMDCGTYLPTWSRQGYSGGRVVRVEVEFKNGGLPTRNPHWYVDPQHAAELFGDAVARYRIAATPENAKGVGVKRATRRSRCEAHPAWLALCERAAKWMAPPVPTWTKARRLDAAKIRASRALGAIAARLRHDHAEMDDLDATYEALRALGKGVIIVAPHGSVPGAPGVQWVIEGQRRGSGLDEEAFQRARSETTKREALLEGLAREREAQRPPVAVDPFRSTQGRSPLGNGRPRKKR